MAEKKLWWQKRGIEAAIVGAAITALVLLWLVGVGCSSTKSRPTPPETPPVIVPLPVEPPVIIEPPSGGPAAPVPPIVVAPVEGMPVSSPGTIEPPPGPAGTSTPPTPIVVPPSEVTPVIVTHTATGDRIVLADFEDGLISPRWQFLKESTTNAGKYTWNIEHDGGAAGTKRSLRLDVTHGAPYIYWMGNERLPGAAGPAKSYMIPQGKKVNRLAFWIKLPVGWGQTKSKFYNIHVGWYLSMDPSKNETSNGHLYHFLYMVPDGKWNRVVLQANYAHERSQAPGFDPGWTKHLMKFDGFWNRLTRFYICGVPNPGDFEFAPVPHTIWIDEVELYYEEDVIYCDPPMVKVPAGGVAFTKVHNLTDKAVTYQVKATKISGLGVEVQSSITIPANSSKELRMVVRGVGTNNVVIYPSNAPQNPQVQNRSDNASYRGSYDNVGAACLVVGE